MRKWICLAGVLLATPVYAWGIQATWSRVDTADGYALTATTSEGTATRAFAQADTPQIEGTLGGLTGNTAAVTVFAQAGTIYSPASNTITVSAGDTDNDGLLDASDPCPTDPRNLCFGPVATDLNGLPLRINVGTTGTCAGPRTDCKGGSWRGDVYGTGGVVHACDTCIVDMTQVFGCDSTATQDLIQCDRFARATGPMSYAIPIANGHYLLNLYFGNTYSGTNTIGKRIFDVVVEGVTRYANFDEIAAAGDLTAVVRSAIVDVTDGMLNISFTAHVENPELKGIEVLAASVAPECLTAADCNDDNGCTDDSCSSGTCVHANNALGCDDGLFCNGLDKCLGGSCASHAGDPCLAGTTCDETADTCLTPTITLQCGANLSDLKKALETCP